MRSLVFPVAMGAAFLVLSNDASAQYKVLDLGTPDDVPSTYPEPVSEAPFGGPGGGFSAMPSRYTVPPQVPGQRVVGPRAPQQPRWEVPAGMYGLQLADGTRMVGRPASGWSATLKTTYGTITIPLTQIAHIVPAGNGQFAAYLKTGDRVTGALVSPSLQFETQFGMLKVAAADMVRLLSSSAAVRVPSGGLTGSPGATPGSPGGLPGAGGPSAIPANSPRIPETPPPTIRRSRVFRSFRSGVILPSKSAPDVKR
jgi:hypothetical protein